MNRIALAIGIAAVLALAARGAVTPPRDDGESPAVTVFAAASLADAMEEIGRRYEEEQGVRVRLNLASSSTLARQIAAGARADVFLAANPQWMDHVDGAGLVASGSRFDFLTNRLVFVQPAEDMPITFECRSGFDAVGSFAGRLALGDPDHVPAGMYARKALLSLGWWPLLEERLLPCANVRDALRVVARGEAELGIVYATDAVASPAVRTVATIPTEHHAPIRYVAAACRDGGGAREFLAYLRSEAASGIFRRHGFLPILSASEE